MTLTEEKTLIGIKYFVRHTKNVGRTKLFKLLYFWDFMHFKRFGMSVTGYEYYTFPFGPVPQGLYEIIKNDALPKEWKDEIEIVEEDIEREYEDSYKQFSIKLKSRKIDTDILSPNELKILHDVSVIFKNVTARQITDISHLLNQPWDTTVKTKGMNKVIDYFLAIDDETTLDLETITERYNLQKELLASGRA